MAEPTRKYWLEKLAKVETEIVLYDEYFKSIEHSPSARRQLESGIIPGYIAQLSLLENDKVNNAQLLNLLNLLRKSIFLKVKAIENAIYPSSEEASAQKKKSDDLWEKGHGIYLKYQSIKKKLLGEVHTF